jgi:hypothetical protein
MGASAGGFDEWVLRLDRNGKKIWEKVFGGQKQELLFDMHIAASGQILLAGNSISPPAGNKTGPAYGEMDFWLVQIDGNGTK